MTEVETSIQETGSGTPLVSVLVTVYNREAYLREAVESALASTYRNIEVIIVDDASTDRSLTIARQLKERDARVRVYSNDANLGDYHNRQRAASYARGCYLKYLDADDIIYPHGLQVMVEAMERFPEAGLALSYNVIDDIAPYPQCVSSRQAYQSFFLGNNILAVGPSAAIIRRDAFEEVNGFSGRRHIGDTELWLKLAARRPVIKLAPSLVWWRRHAGQEIVREGENPEILAQRLELVLTMLRSCGDLLTAAEKEQATCKLKHQYARRLLALTLKHRQWRAGLWLYRHSELAPLDLLSGLRRQRAAQKSDHEAGP